MDAVTVYNPQEIGAAPIKRTKSEQREIGAAPIFDGTLFMDFVTWIDRNEKTTRTYLTNLRQFMTWTKYAGITSPTRQDIIFYRQYLSTEHDAITLDPDSAAGWKYRTDGNGEPIKVICRPNTIEQYLRSVSQFFKWTDANNLYPNIAANIHAPKVKRDTHRKEALTATQVLTIENSITARAAERQQTAQEAAKDTAGRIQRSTEQGKRLYAIYLLAVNAGLRTIEISRANVKDLETRDGQAYIYIWGKGHEEADQRKPIAREVATAINDYLKSRSDKPTGTSPLFVATGNRSGGKRIATTTISTMLKRAMQEAGFDSDRITAHSLRHTAGNTVRKITGNNIYETQKYMRHTNPKTTEIYMHDGEEETAHQADISQQLYNMYHGTTQIDTRAQLESILDRLTPQQLNQIKDIAAAIH